MLQDAICPGCTHTFPVTQARGPFTAVCPRCEIELTLEFQKPAKPPEPGQPPYDLVVRKGGLPAPVVSGKPKKERRRDEDDEDEPKRKGGSATIAFVSGGLAMLFVFCSLAATGWLLFTQVDTTTTWTTGGSNFGNNFAGNNGGNGGRTDPAKPTDVFELKPVSATLPLIAPPADLDPSAPKTLLLPGEANMVAVGGGGRYLVLHFPKQGRLAVFDANIADLLPGGATMENNEASVTAGATRMVTTVPGGKKLRVYSLPDLKALSEFEVPMFFGPKTIAMGSRANGPVVVADVFGRSMLMDVAVGKMIDGSERDQLLHSNFIRATADGRMFLATNGYGVNDKPKIADESQKKWRVLEPDVAAAYPGPDGKLIYAKDMIVEMSGNQVKVVAGRPKTATGNVWYVPAVTATGHYFLRVNETKAGTGPQAKTVVSVALHKDRNVDKVLLSPWEGLPETEGFVNWGNNTVPLDRHLFLIPEAKLLVILSNKKTQLIVRKLMI
jgi:hypothetical protein